MRHLLSIADLTRDDIERLLDRAAAFAEVSDRDIKKVPALRGRTVLNLFYEASTRTRSSFELAAKRLSADVVNFAASGSSVEKGESLKDTVLTLTAHSPDAIVIRTPYAGAAALVAGWTTAAIVNAGDGKHEHPTQALLDVFTLRQKLGSLEGRTIWIVGDVSHSRVARSNILAFRMMGAHVTVCGPPTLIPRGIEALGCEVRYDLDDLREADVVYALRMQNERMDEAFVPTPARVRRALPDQRPPARAAPGAHAPRPGQPRRRALRRGRRLAAGRHHDAGQGRRRRPDGRPLRGARRRARGTRAPGRGRPSRSSHERPPSSCPTPAAAAVPRPGPARRATRRGSSARPPARPTCSSAARTCSTRARAWTARTTSSSATARSPRSAPPAAIAATADVETIDGAGRHLFPAFVDPHVHLRTPGQEHKEDLETGTRSAAAGGYCAIVAMPNTSPVVDSAPILGALLDAAAREARVPVGFTAAITRGLHGEELTEMAELRELGAAAFTDDGRPVIDAGVFRRALQYQRLCGGVLALHEEDPALSGKGAMHEGAISTELGVLGIPSVSESTMIARDCALAEYEGARIHIQHLSARESVEVIAAAKARGVQVTCEASPHHLTMTDEDVRGLDTRRKMNPPLRARVRPPGARSRGCAAGSSTASRPTTRRTRATRRRSRSSRRRWGRPASRRRSRRSTPTSSCPATSTSRSSSRR